MATPFSQEGTTQGDPLAMPMYALATFPLIRNLSDLDNSTSKLWYADDVTATGQLSHLRTWWDRLNTIMIRPAFGYHPNASNTWLVPKEAHLSSANASFQGSHVNITTEGRPHLGAALGTKSYISQHVNNRVEQWSNDTRQVSYWGQKG